MARLQAFVIAALAASAAAGEAILRNDALFPRQEREKPNPNAYTTITVTSMTTITVNPSDVPSTIFTAKTTVWPATTTHTTSEGCTTYFWATPPSVPPGVSPPPLPVPLPGGPPVYTRPTVGPVTVTFAPRQVGMPPPPTPTRPLLTTVTTQFLTVVVTDPSAPRKSQPAMVTISTISMSTTRTTTKLFCTNTVAQVQTTVVANVTRTDFAMTTYLTTTQLCLTTLPTEPSSPFVPGNKPMPTRPPTLFTSGTTLVTTTFTVTRTPIYLSQSTTTRWITRCGLNPTITKTSVLTRTITPAITSASYTGACTRELPDVDGPGWKPTTTEWTRPAETRQSAVPRGVDGDEGEVGVEETTTATATGTETGTGTGTTTGASGVVSLTATAAGPVTVTITYESTKVQYVTVTASTTALRTVATCYSSVATVVGASTWRPG